MPRLDLSGAAQHVIQRGNDRKPCFFRELDYIRYLQDLRDASLRFNCAVHAFVLMTNHVHLLVTPRTQGGVSRMMQALGRSYVRYINDSQGRTGTLWEGRFKSCLIEDERYLLACYRYIELNPVRAGMVERPEQYRWTSYHANGLGAPDLLLTPHPTYLLMVAPEGEGRARYRDHVAQGVPAPELSTVRLYINRQRALGSEAFQQRVESILERRAGLGKPGRPRKHGTDKLVL
jgi:putative transposase